MIFHRYHSIQSGSSVWTPLTLTTLSAQTCLVNDLKYDLVIIGWENNPGEFMRYQAAGGSCSRERDRECHPHMRYDLKRPGWSWSSRACGVLLLREKTPNMPHTGPAKVERFAKWSDRQRAGWWRETASNHMSRSWVWRGASERSLQIIPVLSHSSAVRSNQDHNRFIQLIYSRQSWRGVIFGRFLRQTKTPWGQNLFACSHVSYFGSLSRLSRSERRPVLFTYNTNHTAS